MKIQIGNLMCERPLLAFVIACVGMVPVSEVFADPEASGSTVGLASDLSFASFAQQHVAEQLLADRQFVAETIHVQQQKLEELMSYSAAMMSWPQEELLTEGLFASRMEDFAEVQANIVTDYSEMLSLRTFRVADDVDNRNEALLLLFFQTGSIFGMPDVPIVPQASVVAQSPDTPGVPNNAAPEPLGGFFHPQNN